MDIYFCLINPTDLHIISDTTPFCQMKQQIEKRRKRVDCDIKEERKEDEAAIERGMYGIRVHES